MTGVAETAPSDTVDETIRVNHYDSEKLDGSVPATTVGYEYADDTKPPVIGEDPTIRPGTVVYDDVEIGDRFTTGHHALVREPATIGDDVLVGSQVVIDGETTIGDGVSLQTGVYVPQETEIHDDVFVGSNSVLTNDPYPLGRDIPLDGPVLEDDVSIGANATILPSVTIGERSFVAAGAIVTSNIPPETLAVGSPAESYPLSSELEGGNDT